MESLTGPVARIAAGKDDEEKARILYRALCFKSPFFMPILAEKKENRSSVPGKADYKELLLKLRLLECINTGFRASRDEWEYVGSTWSRRKTTSGTTEDRSFPAFHEDGGDKADADNKNNAEGKETVYYYIDVEDEWP
ncbi:MAG: hypothetical protein ACKO2L_16540 [Planctomycetaceae bacterium]